MAPQKRISCPTPPPSVSPAIPVSDAWPPVTASPNSCVAASRSLHRQPGCAVAVRASGSTTISFIPDMSSISPPSATALPVTLWPPPRTENSKPLLASEVDRRDHVVDGRRRER